MQLIWVQVVIPSETDKGSVKDDGKTDNTQKPAGTKPAEKPVQTPVTKPAGTKPAEKPAETPVQKPAESKPAESKPETKPDENTKTDENKLSSMKLDDACGGNG